ncbi:MAG: hypothetical protein J0I06_09100 [Planctomycetes bacterium]|nr:hypothetical protein [Planctomycetota bacterium]
MRRVLALALTVLPLALRTLPAQEVVPLKRGESPSAARPLPGEPAVPMMVPPVPPPGYTPTPRGDALEPNALDRRLSNPFAQATEAGGQAARTFNENFDGDFGGVFYTRRITTGFVTQPRVVGFTQRVVGFTPTTTTNTVQTTSLGANRLPIVTNTVTTTTTNVPIIVTDPVVVQDPVAQQRLVRLVLAARYSGVLITDNDSPRPQDRVYGGLNFYDNIGGSLNPGLGGTDLQRQTVGFEKTFLGGDASFGMRLPFVQQYGPAAIGSSHNVGDLSLLWKYAIVNDRETGNLWSAGFVLTTPTGSGNAFLADGTKAPHSVLFQPWTGVVRVFDRWYAQGITSFILPSDGRDPTMWNNSVAFGYFLYRGTSDRWLTGVVPTAEVHVRTPLSHNNPADLVFLQDQVNLTGGLHFRFNRAVLSTAVGVPVVGPRPWAVEALGFFNFYF